MKKAFTILMLAAAVLTLSGCDFFRRLAGRPTGEEIEAKRIELVQAREAQEKARLDSIMREQKVVQDSLDALEAIKEQNVLVAAPSRLGGLYKTELDARYHIIVGSYREKTNAELMLDKVLAQGYAAKPIVFRSGMIAVGLCPVNKVADAWESLQEVRKEAFCPSDAWLLLNE